MARFLIPSIFDELFNVADCCTEEKCCTPARSSSGLYIGEDETAFLVSAPIPGADPADAEVKLDREKRLLTISAKVKTEKENIKHHLLGRQHFFYEIPVPASVDFNSQVQASYKNGMLDIAIPKAKIEEPVKIEVKIA